MTSAADPTGWSPRKRRMDPSRASKLTDLKFQIRSLKQRERSLVFLSSRTCEGNKAEAERELATSRRHIREAKHKLETLLRKWDKLLPRSAGQEVVMDTPEDDL